jgi:cytochrome P450
MSRPLDPIAAVTHADPYPYYADLAAGPLERHPGIGMWVAARAADVRAVLASDLCRVRPPAEPVPRAIAGTAAGSVFGRLVRMNDGPAHGAARRIVEAALRTPRPSDVSAASRELARSRADALGLRREPSRVMELAFDVPARVMGGLLGLDARLLDRVVSWTGDFVRGIAAGADADRCERGARAAAHLEDALTARDHGSGLLNELAEEAERDGGPAKAVVIANAIGFLSQPYEATAGLIGNTLVALSRDHALHGRVRSEPRLVADLVQEVLRHDPSTHNTRRFVARGGTVAGVSMEEGDAILVVLAAANRDPALNPDPEAFRLDRDDRRMVSFGSGPHACPGDRLAASIAGGAIEAILDAGVPLEGLAGARRYLPSVNVRIPVFSPAA